MQYTIVRFLVDSVSLLAWIAGVFLWFWLR